MSYYSRWNYFSNFVEDEGFSYDVSLDNPEMGSVTVLTQPTCQNPTAVFYAVANSGYSFDHWSDSNTDNPRSLTLSSDTSIVANFAQIIFDTIYIHDTIIIHDTVYVTQEGIGGGETINAMVYVQNGQIVVEGADGNTVTLYDMSGRVLANKRDDYTPLRFDAPASGAYMIRIGNYLAKRVVVIR